MNICVSQGGDVSRTMRVLIVTDTTFVANALRRELRHVPGCSVIGYMNGRRRCQTRVATADPDVVVVDEMRAQGTALARIRELRAAMPNAKLVLLTACMNADWLAEASAAGIDAAIAKTPRPTPIGLLVSEVAAGNVFHAFSRRAAPADEPAVALDLTSRELEILCSAADGASNGEIARRLLVSERTVKFHLTNAYRKLGVSNRTEASRYAHVHGLLSPRTADTSIRAAA
jgi:DNA-binding NarL/FixJ family response regulator